jgi:DNA (cytosine-5)-methyltransferase 1
LVFEFFRLVNEVRPRYFIFENVANLVTAALEHRPIAERPGKHWSLKSYEKSRTHGDKSVAPMRDTEMSGSAIKVVLDVVRQLSYRFTMGVLDAADYGAPQHRLRFVMIGSRDGLPPLLPKPTHGPAPGLRPFVTVRDAIFDLQANPGPHYKYTDNFRDLFARVPPGGYWKDLPEDLQRKALGNAFSSGGGKTGFFRRLSWDRPSPTVTGKPNRKGAAMCHPAEERPISIRESARLQGFPDDWTISGPMEAQYRQIGNAVPVNLGAALGRSILSGSLSAEQDLDPDDMLAHAISRLRSSARNKKSRAAKTTSAQSEFAWLKGESDAA